MKPARTLLGVRTAIPDRSPGQLSRPQERFSQSFTPVTATELVLKERLTRVHPSLIFRNIDAKDFTKERTVDLRYLPQRLTNLGVRIDAKEAKQIETFAAWRNEIVHHMPSFDERAVPVQIPRLLDYLATFLRSELETPLETFLPKDLYKTAHAVLDDWQQVISKAKENANTEGHVLVEYCPECGTRDVICLRDNGHVHCHMCGSLMYYYDRCSQCGRRTMIAITQIDHDGYCDDCIRDAGDRYIQSLIDIERGK